MKKNKLFPPFFIGFILCLCMISYTQAQTIRYVTQNGAGTKDGSSWANASDDIQAMIDAFTGGGQIWVAGGTYYPTKDPFGNTSPTDPRDKTFYMKDGVQLWGGFAGNETTLAQRNASVMYWNKSTLSGDIGAQGTNTDNCYHVVLSVDDGLVTTLNGFTVAGGNANVYSSISVNGIIERYCGAGMYIKGGATRVDSCSFSNNTIGYAWVTVKGGGLYNNGLGSINNCIFSNNANNNSNSVETLGGGLFNTGSIVQNCFFINNGSGSGSGAGCYNLGGTILNCTFTNGWIQDNAGGLYNEGGDVINCIFQNNHADWNGGAIYKKSGKIINCKFINNSAASGGGIYNNSADNIERCLFDGNQGSGVYNAAGSTNIVDCIFHSNSGNAGGGIYNKSAAGTVRQCAFSQNGAAVNQGGAIYNEASSKAYIYGSTFANNSAALTGGGIYNANAAASTMEVTNSIIWGNNSSQPAGIGGIATVTYSLVQMQGTGVYQGTGNINQNPIFHDAANPKGGDNEWFTVDDGFSISCSSPAIDAGDDNQILTGSKDITGITDRITLNHVDMGAYEFPSTANITASSAAIDCANATVTLTATGGTSYSWNTGATTASIVVNTPNNYTVNIINGSCTTTLSKLVTQSINPPNVGIIADPAAALCPNQQVKLIATGAAFYNWNNGIINDVLFTPTDTTTYTVIATGANGCTASASYTVYVAEMPTISVIGFNTLICNFAGPGVTYQWNQNGSPQGGATSQTYTPTANGIPYNVTVTTNNPVCSTPSNSITLTNVGIEDNHFSGLLVYPNPTKEKLFIENLPLDSHLSLQSIIGGKILWENNSVNSSSLTIDMQNLPAGVYFLSLEQQGQRFTQKVVKE